MLVETLVNFQLRDVTETYRYDYNGNCCYYNYCRNDIGEQTDSTDSNDPSCFDSFKHGNI